MSNGDRFALLPQGDRETLLHFLAGVVDDALVDHKRPDPRFILCRSYNHLSPSEYQALLAFKESGDAAG
jgi:hypothetical protein